MTYRNILLRATENHLIFEKEPIRPTPLPFFFWSPSKLLKQKLWSGAWKRAVEGIKNCVEAGLDTGVATTATHYNLKEIPKLVEFIEKDLHAKRFIVFNFIPVSRGKEIMDQDLTPKEREELLDFLYSKLIDNNNNNNIKLDTFSTAPQYAVTSYKFAFGPVVATHFTNKAATEMLKGRTKSNRIHWRLRCWSSLLWHGTKRRHRTMRLHPHKDREHSRAKPS